MENRITMEILKQLGLEANNPGAYFGHGQWSETTDAGQIKATNPATGEIIATVNGASVEDYERIVSTAQKVFADWRTVPAPRRGDIG